MSQRDLHVMSQHSIIGRNETLLKGSKLQVLKERIFEHPIPSVFILSIYASHVCGCLIGVQSILHQLYVGVVGLTVMH